MPSRLLAAALAACALSLSPAVAHADDVAYGCAFPDADPGSTYEGAIVAYLVASPDVIKVRCYLTLDGLSVAEATATRTSPVAVTAVTILTTGADSVATCMDVTRVDGTTTVCSGPVGQIPPQEVLDLIERLGSVVDAVLCPPLGSLAPGVPDVVDIGSDGDVSVLGVPVVDCPPR